jgi:hypothetical protein
MLSEKNFSPYIGLGAIFSPTSLEGIEVTDSATGATYVYNTSASLYGQGVFGLEYISNGGFYIAWNIGYAPSLKKNYEFVTTPDEANELAVKLIYGSGISTALNIGYAF